MNISCRICHEQALQKIIDLGELPIAHRLPSKVGESELLFPLSAHLCSHCGMIQIVDPIDPNLLYTSYNYNFSSWKPEPHLSDELDTIFAHIQPASAFEIGCNDGRFLNELLQRGVGVGVGIEPNPVSGEMARQKGIDLLGGMVSADLGKEAVRRHGRFDLVVARQVLEHVFDPRAFFACIAETLADNGMLFIDVPDAEAGIIQGDCAILWEEHIYYFTESVLLRLLHENGFEPVSIQKYNFNIGTLAVLSRFVGKKPGVAHNPSTSHLTAAASFGSRVHAYGEQLRAALTAAKSQGETVFLYGVGCRACTLVNGLQLGPLIDIAVDDQQERQGRLMPGSQLLIHPSERLAEGNGPVICLLAVNIENETKVMERVGRLTHRPIRFLFPFAPGEIRRGLQPPTKAKP